LSVNNSGKHGHSEAEGGDQIPYLGQTGKEAERKSSIPRGDQHQVVMGLIMGKSMMPKRSAMSMYPPVPEGVPMKYPISKTAGIMIP
jgi:hypothetical protein